MADNYQVKDANAATKTFAADDDGTTLRPRSIGAGTKPTKSLDAATATGAGTAVQVRGAKNITMQVYWTSSPSALICSLEGSLDNSHWGVLATFDLAGDPRVSGDLISVGGIPVEYVRANLTTLTGGSTPAVTATVQGG